MEKTIYKPTLNATCVAICVLSLNTLPALAFPDIYEPDNMYEEANVVVTDNESPERHELSVVKRRALRIIMGELKGTVIDAISGNPIKDAVVFTTCHTSDTAFSETNGDYNTILSCKDGKVFELTAKANGYKPLTCSLTSIEILTLIRNIPLLPNGKNLPAPTPSQSVYSNGDKLQVTLPNLYEGCVDYYVAIAYPPEVGSSLFIVTKTARNLNDLTAFTGYPLQWNGSGNVAIDMPIENMPHGIYTLYLLRTPEGVADPLADKYLENLSFSFFEVKD